MENLEFKPTGHRVLIRPDIKEKTDSGIILHYDERLATKDCDTGIIADIGFQAWKDYSDGSPWAKVGDRVYFSKYGAKVIKNQGQFFVICNDEDVLAILNSPLKDDEVLTDE